MKKSDNEFNEFKKQMEKLLESSRDALIKGKEEILRLTQAAGLYFDVYQLKRRQEEIFEKLGKQVFKSKGMTKKAEELLKQAGEIEKKIAEAKKLITKLEKKASKKAGKKRTKKGGK